MLLVCNKFLFGLVPAYGSKEEVSPSPLLSALIHGCMEKGRDLAGGGARYHLFSPLMTGISTAADSLYVIKSWFLTRTYLSYRNWSSSFAAIGVKIRQVLGCS